MASSRQCKVTRRTALAGLGATGMALAMPGILRAQSSQLVMATGGGKLDDAYRTTIFNPWKEGYGGIDVITTSNEGARLKAMVEQNNVEWDLIQGPAEELVVYAREGLLEPIDFSGIDRDKMIEGSMHEHFVLTDLAAHHIAWNTDNISGEGPGDWSALFNLDGRISLWKKPFQTLEVALLADGVSPAELYPLDIDRALASLDNVSDKVLWWDTGAQGAQMLIDGEVDAGSTWNGRVHEPRKAGAPVDFHFNQAVLVSDAWAVPAGAPNKEKALELLAYALSAEAQAAFAKAIPYGPVNTDAEALLDEEVKADLPKLDGSSVMLDVDYWADHSAEATERFNNWLLG
ncbi:extracellular solute-binding protein [Chelativorans sp. Marseille-P2723]|uniref:extracellular solute-binding protein n=1 Tax=Chelativorans sp. Marseille-P2723 TaxID=2709133 RepID=UPI00156F9448|nr:extracellular solute-binding protein [Chelativorans sp. Marseille-P2723]